jgi:hypothetical protein
MFSHIIHSAKFSSKAKTPSFKAGSPEAASEIRAYIAVRDLHLADAEASPGVANLNRATMANEFVLSCLKPARLPYQAQSLPEIEAERERERCAAAKVRLSALRAQLAHAA